MGTSINCLFARLRRWMIFCDPHVSLYTAVLKIHPPCTRTKTLINRGTHMTVRIDIGGLRISRRLYDLVADEILSEMTGIDGTRLWSMFAEIIREFAPENKRLLQKRDELQSQINNWHLNHADASYNVDHADHVDHAGHVDHADQYKKFLLEIGYLLPEGEDFKITTDHVDPEIATIAGPQLVAPVNNARFALNAANARWGSLYDAFYGTDVIPETAGLEKGLSFNNARGREVIERGLDFLDQAVALTDASYHEVVKLSLNGLTSNNTVSLEATLADGQTTSLQSPQFMGYQNQNDDLVILLKNNGLHIELHIDSRHPIGNIVKLHPSGIKDIILESALTTIQDCEDSVAAVDAEDKTLVYRNWLGLMKGDLEEIFYKQGKETKRSLNPDRFYVSPEGDSFSLSGRSLMLVRNVGHLMTTDAVLTSDGLEVPEGILDAMMTSLIGLYGINPESPNSNSKAGSIYIVKPKMHGPDEVAFTVKLFSRIEEALGLARNTIKIGIMDEERRTTVNLKECIRAAKERVIFINTGFLDRTGDEIHTSMEAGAFLPKADIKKEPWISAYEDWNVDIGLLCGLQGKAQIGKGMWAMPDLMGQMLKEKIGHPKVGANCAWVPSPTAATLHATHYHQVDVAAQQEKLKSRQRASLDDILSIPLLGDRKLSKKEIQQELDNNAQGILGYVVRWVDQGVGCSKVPDINHVGLMEDRATLRISSQHMANWLHHDICTEAQVVATFERMAIVVDEQNTQDPNYKSMAPSYSGIAYQAALDLVLKGYEQPSGYTEPLLHEYRKQFKKSLN